MKKLLIKIFLVSIILVGFGNITQINAGDLDCKLMSKEIENYSSLKTKIDNLFIKLSKKDKKIKNKYYTKISKITDKYLKKLNKQKQKKLYTIVGYLKCENIKTQMNNNYGSYELDKLGGLYYIKGNNKYYIDSKDNDDTGEISKIKIIGNYLTYSKSTIYGDITRVFDIEKLALVNSFGRTQLLKHYVISCTTSGYFTGDVSFLNLYSGEKIKLSKKNEIIESCEIINNNIIKYKIDGVDYKYNLSDSKFDVSDKNKKGKFIKYIGGGVEARQSKMYTYFYYNGKLFNTIKNKVNDDAKAMFDFERGWIKGDKDKNGYLSEYYAKRKLDLYSAELGDGVGTKYIMFKKKSDSGVKEFLYLINSNEWID